MMNRRQKLVQQQFLNNETAVIKRLEYIYDKALFDIDKKIKELDFKIGDLTETYEWLDDDDPNKDVVQSMIQSKIYQKQYQQTLHDQLDGILNKMRTEEYLTIADYLDTCYEDGFVGSLFDLHGQDIPLMMPINQESMVRAIQLDSKISQGLYTRLGEDVNVLKKRITAEVTRSIATGASYAQTAKRLANQTKVGFNNAIRIARTEGHRIQTTAAMDVMEAAKEKGADVLKQWDATLDDNTRESHAQVDGEIKELDEKFSNGLMYPGDPAGGAAEVVNCRCALLQRARWALDEDELQTLKDRAAYFGLDKSEQFDDFKKKYLKAIADEPVADSAFTRFVYHEAKTLQEAEAFARDTIGIPNVSYKGMDIRVANSMNEALTNAMNYCPDIRTRIQFYGSAQERNKQIKKELEAYYIKYFEAKYGAGSALAEKYGKQYASRFVGKVTSRVYAYAYSGDVKGINVSDELRQIVRKWSGIGMNANKGKDFDDMLASLKWDVESGWHPIGCDTVKSILDHEFGHQIDYAFGLSKNPTILGLRAGMTKSEQTLAVSQYAATNIQEFIAEAYAEYVNNPNPRKIAATIGEIIESMVNGK